MSDSLTLRIKCLKSQNLRVNGISGSTTVHDLLYDHLHLTTGIPVEKMVLRVGFPPKKLSLPSDLKSTTITELGIRHQDTIIVVEDKEGGNLGRGQGQSSTQIPTQGQGTSSSGGNGIEKPQPRAPPPSAASIANEYKSPIPSQFLDKEPLSTAEGFVLRKVVPSDNSCLFRSVLYSMGSDSSAPSLRKVIATTVRGSPGKYTEGFLEQSNSSYATWIQKPDSWGGGIELSILSDYYEVEIAVMDIQNIRFNRFGEDKSYANCIYLLYDGIHYDAIFWESFDGSTQLTKFDPKDEHMREMVRQLGEEAKASHQFTDMKNFKLRCTDCKQKVSGDVGLQKHAKATGHVRFEEVKEHNYL